MSDRLEALRRQRALVQTHLDWLDREIAANAPPPGTTLPLTREVPSPTSAPVSTLRHTATAILAHTGAPAPAPVASRGESAADAILAEYRVQPDSLKTNVRQGCFIYFFGALALLAAAIAVFYYAAGARVE